MFWYLFLAASPIILLPMVNGYYKTSVNKDQKAKKVYLFWCGFILFLMIALRNKSLGSVDSTNYYNNWIKLREMPFSKLSAFMNESDMESGYLFFIWVISRVFYEPQFVFVLSGLLFTIAVCRTIFFNSDNVMLSMVTYICLGLYMFMVQGLRQSIAISICLLSIELIKKRKFIPFALLIILACCFHRTAVVFSIMYFVYGCEFNSKTKLKLVIGLIVLMALAPLLVRLGNAFLDREYESTASSGAIVASLIYVIIIFAAFIFLDENTADKNITFFITMTVLGGAFYLMRFTGAQAMERISFYFIMGQTIVLPSVIKRFNLQSRYVLNAVVISLSIILFLYRISSSYGLPYLFFWQ